MKHLRYIIETEIYPLNDLLPLNAVIQVCPECSKVDASTWDDHDCLSGMQKRDEYYD